MEIERLREYIVLAHRLNFTSAAKELHLSQPTLSNHIKALESEVKTDLIERIPGDSARVTPAGQEFLAMALTVVKTYDKTMDKLKAMRSAISGKIRIRSPRYEYSHPFLEYVQEFRAQHPDVDIVLSPWVSEDGYPDVSSGKVDCAYVGQGTNSNGESEDHPDLKLVAYADMESFIWVNKNDPLEKKETLSATDLDGRCIVIPANQKNESWISTFNSMALENNISLTFEEKYCDSLEDFIMNKIDKDDLFIGFEHLKEMFAFNAQTDHVLRYFTPPLMFRMSIAYAKDNNNPALAAFVQFLHEKYEANKASKV